MTTRTTSISTTTSTTSTSTTAFIYSSKKEIVRSRARRLKILTDQCWSDCELKNNYLTNPACLLDCFPPHHCVSSLLLDFAGAGGVCRGSFTSRYFSALWPTSHRSCSFLTETDRQFTARDDYQIKEGICSAKTEALLLDQENCILPLYEEASSVLLSLQTLIWSSCSWQTFQAWRPSASASPQPTTLSSISPRSQYKPNRLRVMETYNFGKRENFIQNKK